VQLLKTAGTDEEFSWKKIQENLMGVWQH